MTGDPRLTYAEALTRAADDLDDALAALRAAQDAGTVTVTEAASRRVQLLERHLERVARLRAEHPGGAS